MRLSEPITNVWMKIDLYYQRQICQPMTLVSGGIRVRRGSLGRGVKRQWGCRQRQCSAFSLAIFSDTLEMRPALLYGDTQSVSAFQWSQNAWPWMTLNCYLALNSVFAPVWLAETVRLSKNNYVKINKDRHIHVLSAVQIFGRDSNFWQYKVCADIRSGSLEIRR